MRDCQQYLLTRDVLGTIQSLDPVKDAQKIVLLSASRHFPIDSKISLELALFRTYAVPSIGALLDRTGEFAQRPQRRYDDTGILIAEFLENGLDSERGRAAIERMNAIHSRYRIANDDFLYVLSTFIYEPIRWNERFGWRLLLPQERQASFQIWREIGLKMGIREIPESYEAFETFNRDYERRMFHFNPSSQRVGEATLGLFISWYPRFLAPFIRQAIYTVLDEPVRRAFGFPDPHALFRVLIPSGLKVWAYIYRILPKRRTPLLRHKMPYPSYPGGHRIEDVGPPSHRR